MSLTREQRRKLVELLLATPPASSFTGRTALLGDARDLALNRDQGNARLDLDGIVQQLDQLRADHELRSLIENAIEYVRGTPVAASLEALLPRPEAPAQDVSNRERLALEAASRGKPGLTDQLDRLCGRVLKNIYRIDSLSNMGSQFAVFRGTDLQRDQPVAIKLPFVDYTRPASFGRREVELAREAAKREWEALLRHHDRRATLPWPYDLVTSSNPLLEGRGADPVWAQEAYLVEGWVDGASFDELRQQLFSSQPSGEQIMEVVLPLMTSLLSVLSRLEPELFADVAPRNFIWCNETKTTRLVDAGSLVVPGTPLWVPDTSETGARSRITTAVTLPYLSAHDIAAHHRGEERTVESTSVIFAIGKMFHEFATNLHPLNGQDPSLDAEPYLSLPRQLRGALDLLLAGTLGSMSAATSAVIAVAGVGRR